MRKKRKNGIDPRLIEALKKLPNPLHDERHNLTIYLVDDRARSNESRFEHICQGRHELTVKDIESIPKGIKTAALKTDKNRKDTCSLYLKRRGPGGGFIKICLARQKVWEEVKVKSIFWTNKMK